MPNRVGSDFKLRVAWDELTYLHYKDVALYNRPHVEAFLRGRVGRFLIDNVQNLCWTLERLSKKPQAIAAQMTGHESALTSRGAEGPSRIFLDITHTIRNFRNTGIQRVCRRLAEEALTTGLFVPTLLQSGHLYAVDATGTKTPVDVKAGDVFVILDMFWDPLDEYVAFVTEARRRNVLVGTCFYDVVPSLHPEICAMEFGPTFTRDLKTIYDITDICIAISKATLDDLIEVLSRDGLYDEHKKFFYFHLGSDFAVDEELLVKPIDPLPEAIAHPRLFLSVGTIEPKKGYHLTLDAFDALWAEGHDVVFTIIGRYGWSAESVVSRIEAHPQLNRKLFWLKNASDAVLNAAYDNCYCFVQASVAEGFGLPVVEAAKHNLPIIASDIDVFKEIAGECLIYFESENASSLRDRIVEALNERPVPRPWPVLSWQTSLLDLHKGLTAAVAELRAAQTA
jgi:glycosyltransferase involved in cell wall biosynthesis